MSPCLLSLCLPWCSELRNPATALLRTILSSAAAVSIGTATVGVAQAEEGPRVYVERIDITGNARTQDFIIRREFAIVEGDPYSRALVDRAERRLRNLRYFKTVTVTVEPGSAPDRVIINVDVEEGY